MDKNRYLLTRDKNLIPCEIRYRGTSQDILSREEGAQVLEQLINYVTRLFECDFYVTYIEDVNTPKGRGEFVVEPIDSAFWVIGRSNTLAGAFKVILDSGFHGTFGYALSQFEGEIKKDYWKVKEAHTNGS